jgi:hypothetical protein
MCNWTLIHRHRRSGRAEYTYKVQGQRSALRSHTRHGDQAQAVQ